VICSFLENLAKRKHHDVRYGKGTGVELRWVIPDIIECFLLYIVDFRDVRHIESHTRKSILKVQKLLKNLCLLQNALAPGLEINYKTQVH
jgi:hypothetical protein